jgi:nucleoside-diphosphate-sugar epimerase
MEALVTGAGGFLGLAVIRALRARGDTVRALVRRRCDALAAAGATIVKGDALDAAAVREAVRGCDVVFHLAGVLRAKDPAELRRQNADSTRVILDACLTEAPALRRFVLAGSRSAMGPSRERMPEDAPLAPVDAYGASKAEAERIAFSYADRLPVTVARPPRVLGPGDREALPYFKLARRGLALDFGDHPISWIDLDDCVRGLLVLADHPAATGEAFFLASNEVTSARLLAEEAARALDVRARRVRVPRAVLLGLAVASDAASALTGRRLPGGRRFASHVLAAGRVCSPEKARRRLDFVAGTTLAESVTRTARWYREHGWL